MVASDRLLEWRQEAALAMVAAQSVWAVTDAPGAIEVLADSDLAFGEAMRPVARWYLEFEFLELDAVIVSNHAAVVNCKDLSRSYPFRGTKAFSEHCGARLQVLL